MTSFSPWTVLANRRAHPIAALCLSPYKIVRKKKLRKIKLRKIKLRKKKLRKKKLRKKKIEREMRGSKETSRGVEGVYERERECGMVRGR